MSSTNKRQLSFYDACKKWGIAKKAAFCIPQYRARAARLTELDAVSSKLCKFIRANSSLPFYKAKRDKDSFLSSKLANEIAPILGIKLTK